MSNAKSITDSLKAAIEESGLSFLALQKQTGVTRQSLMSFVKGERTMQLNMADKLAEFFELELQPIATKTKKTKRS